MSFSSALLLVFVKNLQRGRVKQRLAYKIGQEKAYEIYKRLIVHTYEQTRLLPLTKWVFYSEYIEKDDWFLGKDFTKYVQHSGSLGERMRQAFHQGFKEGYRQIIIIGSDCYELQRHHIEQAFKMLERHTYVLGPAKDGGYYLLGMRQETPDLFRNIPWSSSKVLSRTLEKLSANHNSYVLMPVLSDVDYVKDVPKYWL